MEARMTLWTFLLLMPPSFKDWCCTKFRLAVPQTKKLLISMLVEDLLFYKTCAFRILPSEFVMLELKVIASGFYFMYTSTILSFFQRSTSHFPSAL
jgi:hypothetical protein